jgi:hypothetical protein
VSYVQLGCLLRWGAWTAILLGLACAGRAPALVITRTPSPTTVRVRVFSEPTGVAHLAVVQPYVFAATGDGLDRWDLSANRGLHLNRARGLPGDRVTALAVAPDRRGLWVATDDGLTRYDIEHNLFQQVLPGRSGFLETLMAGAVALAPDERDGVWVGGPGGLAHRDAKGRWTPARGIGHVSALLLDESRRLWIGTPDQGLQVRRPDGWVGSLGPAQGCDVKSVRFFVPGVGGGAIAVGEDNAGRQRIAIVLGDKCTTFRSSPDVRWLSATRQLEEVVVLAPTGLYALSIAPRRRPLYRDGLRLIPIRVPGGPMRSPYLVRRIDAHVPTGALTVAAAGESLLIGTRNIGTAIIARGGKRRSWLRRGELVSGGRLLSVACTNRKLCYIATAGAAVWRFDGSEFQRMPDLGDVVYAVVRTSAGEIVAAYRRGREAQIRIARLHKDQWTALDEIEIKTPGEQASAVFAEMSPRGVLWMGLAYFDPRRNESRAYGVVEVNLEMALVAYHHATRDDAGVEAGVLPIPVDSVDIDFLGNQEVWLATSEGPVRIKGSKVTVFMESDGMVSELVRSIAVGGGGAVFAATSEGVAVFDGRVWAVPRLLQRRASALTVGPDARLWMATPRGVATYDGARVRRLDARRGLLEDEIWDVKIDRFRRVWALSPSGLSVLSVK